MGSKLAREALKTGARWISTASCLFSHKLRSMKSMEWTGRKNITMRKEVKMMKKSENEFTT